MKRSQEEILKRIEEVNDLFGTQISDLVEFLTFENARKFLKDEYVADVESGREEWVQKTDPKKEISDYMDFAYEKAENQRGLSAGRSMLHMKTWIWLDDQEFYEQIIEDIDDYYDYGIPQLNRICNHYRIWRN